MFKKIKFQIITPYDTKMMMCNANVLKKMGVEIEDVRYSELLDRNDNKIGNVSIFVCKASDKVYKNLKKFLTNEETYEGLPTLY